MGDDAFELSKEQSVIEEKAYRDTWGRGYASYLSMMLPRLELAHALLKSSGTLFVHIDYRVDSHLRLMLDEIFGPSGLTNEIAWCYTGPSRVTRDFPDKHDVILRYCKEPDLRWFNAESEHARIRYAKSLRAAAQPTGIYANRDEALDFQSYDERGKLAEDWWSDITPVGRIATEDLKYPTQKPRKLLQRILGSSCPPGGLVADFFVGSGTTADVAETLGLRWIASDLGRFAIHTTRKRLMDIEGVKPFDVLNLGRYERQYWQSASFGGRAPQQVVLEYLAFILRLYGATPVTGTQHIHGKKGPTAVHVGNVDNPVTIGDVAAALDECVSAGQSELHVLGWEWEMGLNDLVDQLTIERKVRLKLLAIPREVMEAQAVEKKDIRFFELAHLAAVAVDAGSRSIKVQLINFAMSGAEGIDPEVMARIDMWSDLVDYWAVDWDFRNDAFVNGWVAYRTRRERRLPLETDAHKYEVPGVYGVAVKVVDVFGNDTTRVFPVEVK